MYSHLFIVSTWDLTTFEDTGACHFHSHIVSTLDLDTFEDTWR